MYSKPHIYKHACCTTHYLSTSLIAWWNGEIRIHIWISKSSSGFLQSEGKSKSQRKIERAQSTVSSLTHHKSNFASTVTYNPIWSTVYGVLSQVHRKVNPSHKFTQGNYFHIVVIRTPQESPLYLVLTKKILVSPLSTYTTARFPKFFEPIPHYNVKEPYHPALN